MQSRTRPTAWLARYALKAGIVIVGTLSLTYVPYLLLGLWNRMFGGWTSVFYCYAGSTQFIDTYAPGFLIRAFRWVPVPIGILRSEGTLGIVLASPLTEDHFLNPDNAVAFERLQRRIHRIARIVGTPNVNLSGILPGVIGADGVLTMEDKRPVVQRAVCAAVKRIVADQFEGQRTPVLLIGGAGFIGIPITQALRASGMEIHVIDPKCADTRMPVTLKGQPCLVLDCSRSGVIRQYVDQMWTGMVLLNEVFPRTPRRVVDALSAKGIPCWHLSGLTGSIFPPLPHGYENAVPCCAAHGADEDPDVVLVQLQ